ncbi:hypothetical protein ACW4TU_16170 [Streptomyces sp. QTS52]
MTEHSDTSQPGIAPGARRTTGTMFAALHGELVPHAWRYPGSEHDAYQLFHQHSLAMGWLDDTGAGAPGLWAMNDAGWGHPLAGPGTELVSWFQVEAGAVPGDRPLPVRPLNGDAAFPGHYTPGTHGTPGGAK